MRRPRYNAQIQIGYLEAAERVRAQLQLPPSPDTRPAPSYHIHTQHCVMRCIYTNTNTPDARGTRCWC
jgi:hypothetical protein